MAEHIASTTAGTNERFQVTQAKLFCSIPDLMASMGQTAQWGNARLHIFRSGSRALSAPHFLEIQHLRPKDIQDEQKQR